LRANHSEHNPSNYGASTFFKLLGSIGTFEIGQRKQGNGHAQFCRPNNGGFKPSRSIQVTHKPPAAYVDALKAAVSASMSPDGWAKISAIRHYLQSHGHRLEGSGFDTLESALQATLLFDMCDAGGAKKIFKLANKTPVA
jgi:hypothetical protein